MIEHLATYASIRENYEREIKTIFPRALCLEHNYRQGYQIIAAIRAAFGPPKYSRHVSGRYIVTNPEGVWQILVEFVESKDIYTLYTNSDEVAVFVEMLRD